VKRSIAALLIAAVALAGFSGCSKKAQAPKKLYIYNWAYYIPSDVLKDFEKANNCEIVYEEFDSNETMYQKISAGGSGYDIVFPGADYASIMIKKGLLEKLEKSKLPNIANIDPAISAKKAFDPQDDYCVPYFLGAAGVMVNKEKVKNYEKSWNIFARKDLKGRMTLLDDVREVFGGALVYDGLSGNSTNQADIDKAKKTIESWKANIANFDSSSFGEGFVNGSLDVVHCFAENVWLALDENQAKNEEYADKYEFFIPKEGNVSYMDTMGLLKESKNKDLAYKFINYIHAPETYARIADVIRVPSLNLKARDLVKVKPNYSMEDVLRCELKVDVGDALQLYSNAWESLRIGG
jgi:spermidine/putrescine transport system substrate-binding protein